MATEQQLKNLKMFQDYTPEERRALAAKGGSNTAKARLRRKKGRELVRALLDLGIEDATVRAALQKAGFDPDKVSNEMAMHVRQIEKAQKTGNTDAYKAVLKAAGYTDDEQPGGGVSINITASPEGKANIEKIIHGTKE